MCRTVLIVVGLFPNVGPVDTISVVMLVMRGLVTSALPSSLQLLACSVDCIEMLGVEMLGPSCLSLLTAIGLWSSKLVTVPASERVVIVKVLVRTVGGLMTAVYVELSPLVDVMIRTFVLCMVVIVVRNAPYV